MKKYDVAIVGAGPVLAFGETLLLENEFVWEHSTADRITCFLEQMYEMNDSRADITVNNEGRMLKEYNTIGVIVPHLSVNETYQVRSIKRRLQTFDMTVVKHANTIYTYNAQTLPVDPQEEDFPDFINPDAPTYEDPKTPINIRYVKIFFITQIVLSGLMEQMRLIHFAGYQFVN